MVSYIIIVYLVALAGSAWAYMFMSDIMMQFVPLFTTLNGQLSNPAYAENTDTLNFLIMLFRAVLIIIVFLLSYWVWVKSQKLGAYR